MREKTQNSSGLNKILFISPPVSPEEVRDLGFYFFKKIYLFMFDCAGSPSLCGLFSSCEELGLLCSCGVRTSHCRSFSLERRLLGAQASVTEARGLGNCGSWP